MAVAKVPIFVEARVRCGLLEDDQVMGKIRNIVHDMVTALQNFKDGPLSLSPDVLEFLIAVRISGVADSASHKTSTLHDANSPDSEADVNSTPTALSFLHVIPHISFYECQDLVQSDDEGTTNRSVPFSSVVQLPAADLEGLWESLRYSTGIKPRLLAYLSSGAQFRKNGVHPCVITWHGVALLHGPPGTGKTSLCRALAQKLAVRSADTAPSYLVEVRADAVFSKFFAQSAKNVGDLFRAVSVLAGTAGHVFVLIDEVESLASSRGSSVDGQPADALRAVNSLLTALDCLRGVTNCTVLATSNLESKIDPAFLDRVDIHEYVPQPGLAARRDILAECVAELSRVGILQAADGKQDGDHVSTENLIQEAAREAKGMSGRALRKLPLLAHSSYVRGTKRSIPTACFLRTLRAAAVRARKNSGTA